MTLNTQVLLSCPWFSDRENGHFARRVFQDAKPAMKAYTLRKQGEIFDWITELTETLKRVVVRKLREGHKNPHPTGTKLAR